MLALHSVIQLKWDRGHEELVGVLHFRSEEGIIITPIFDYCPSRGFKWIRASDITEVVELGPNAAEVRYIATGVPEVPEAPGFEDLFDILTHSGLGLVAVYTSEYGSSETAVGSVLSVDDVSLALELIGPDGLWLGERVEMALADVISVEWMTDYLNALSVIARSE